MDPSEYKDFKTSRGYSYHYFYAAPRGEKPTLILLHGFPTMSLDWATIVPSFKKEGYGLIVPDLLGYGGTDKPTDPKEYRLKLMAEDIIEMIEAEKTRKIISIAHDWGCGLNSRIANYFQDRFEAFAFLAIAYFPPIPDGLQIDAINDVSEKMYGYRYLGYWRFFERDDASEIIEAHLDSFQCLGYAKDPEVLRDHFCHEGQLYKWLITDQKTEIAPYVPQEAIAIGAELAKKYGFKAPLCWYKAVLQGHVPKDDAELSKEDYIIRKPVFFGATLQDPTGPVELMKATMGVYSPKLKVVDFDTSHWLLMEAPEKTIEELLKWLQSLGY
ncbi:hypothetical protein ACEPAI_922 [Sanghuangporus weigelae]